MVQLMTIREWHDNPRFRMRWSIYDEESYAAYDAKSEAIYVAAREAGRGATIEEEQMLQDDYGDVFLDLRAGDIPEGMHPVYHRSGRKKSDEGRSVGVLVEDGYFIIEPTQAAIFEAVCKSYGTTANAVRLGEDFINHVFIEYVTWDAEQRAVCISTGS